MTATIEKHPPTLTVYYRQTDCEGKSHVSSAWVWDKDHFLATRTAEAEEMNEKQKPGKPRLASVQQITEEQYKKERSK